MRSGEYHINWKYTGCEPVIGGSSKISRRVPELIVVPHCETTCNIWVHDGIDNENKPIRKEIVSVTIRKHHTDLFDKRLARKISFKRAIAGFSKEERTALWKTFVENIKL